MEVRLPHRIEGSLRGKDCFLNAVKEMSETKTGG